MGVSPVIADSARKHGVSDEDIRTHAYWNPIRMFELDEGFTMVIDANHAAVIFEIGVVDGRHRSSCTPCGHARSS